MSPKSEPIVAELGRPETPEETAQRRSQASAKRRQGQTLFNLVLALAACIAVVGVVLLFTEQPGPVIPAADYKSIAGEADAAVPLAAPDLPETWHSNFARYNAAPTDKVPTWEVGFLTPKGEFIGLKQGINANPTWVANQLGARAATGNREVDGRNWIVYDYRKAKDTGNLAYSMELDEGTSSFVLYGTAATDEFELVAAQLTKWIANNS
ncbi:MAG: DUF4245 domain-containing protein [Cryobacterium sp.]|nr:DUF4245 domain-containing protein [Cryobacterium sp.]MBX3116319.1 DUF4245 domain-containing protein [Cryobacterium sp.]MCO5293518.1 DUF4245 domain-containing protein [Homoserinimonas sp.]MCW5944821.1 DUF4245 domain-containing protein [Cryobacterium sp.]